jgi:hypothetical protein
MTFARLYFSAQLTVLLLCKCMENYLDIQIESDIRIELMLNKFCKLTLRPTLGNQILVGKEGFDPSYFWASTRRLYQLSYNPLARHRGYDPLTIGFGVQHHYPHGP